jgi:predicted transcriptional regulator
MPKGRLLLHTKYIDEVGGIIKMKVKRLKVGVRSLEEGLSEFKNTPKAIKAGRKVVKRTGVYFISVEAMRQVLTEPRLALLHVIRTRRPQSLAELAKLVQRDFKNVRADIKVLSALGLVEAKAGPRLRDAIMLSVPYQRIQFEIAV